ISCEAEASAIASARAPTTQMASGRLPTPASMRPSAASAIWVTAIHPRRRPQNGGTYRSISGDQTTLNAQGACARVNSPTTRMSTPIERIQSGIEYQTRPSGSPEENDRSATEAVRQERIARARATSAPGLSVVAGGDIASSVVRPGQEAATASIPRARLCVLYYLTEKP